VTGEPLAAAPPNPRVLLVGDLNPSGADLRLALYHLPRHSSGNRLRCVLGLTDLEYHRLLDRANLCDGKWSAEAARGRLADLLDARAPGGVVVLLGARVRDVARRLLEARFKTAVALGFFDQWAAWDPYPVTYDENRLFATSKIAYTVACLPHPSGLCRLWNEPGAVTRARRLLAEVAPWVHWGSRDAELPPARPAREASPEEDVREV
jgi:hypothetical protein